VRYSYGKLYPQLLKLEEGVSRLSGVRSGGWCIVVSLTSQAVLSRNLLHKIHVECRCAKHTFVEARLKGYASIWKFAYILM